MVNIEFPVSRFSIVSMVIGNKLNSNSIINEFTILIEYKWSKIAFNFN